MYHFKLAKKTENLIIPRPGKGMGQQELSDIALRSCTWYNWRMIWQQPVKSRMHIPCVPAVSPLGTLSRSCQISTRKYVLHVHSNTVQQQSMEITKLPLTAHEQTIIILKCHIKKKGNSHEQQELLLHTSLWKYPLHTMKRTSKSL